MNNPVSVLKGKNGQLYIYDDHIEIKRKGLLGFMSHGMAGDKSIPYATIKSVQVKNGTLLANGYIQFGILGAIEKRGGLYNAIDDENAVVITRSQNKEVEKIKEYIESKIFSQSKETNNNSTYSPADEVLKLKQLLDAGLLSNEEFETKKKQILGL